MPQYQKIFNNFQLAYIKFSILSAKISSLIHTLSLSPSLSHCYSTTFLLTLLQHHLSLIGYPLQTLTVLHSVDLPQWRCSTAGWSWTSCCTGLGSSRRTDSLVCTGSHHSGTPRQYWTNKPNTCIIIPGAILTFFTF